MGCLTTADYIQYCDGLLSLGSLFLAANAEGRRISAEIDSSYDITFTYCRDILGFDLANIFFGQYSQCLWRWSMATSQIPTCHQEPGAVYRCFEEPARCPGGEPGTCSFGRDCLWETRMLEPSRSVGFAKARFMYIVDGEWKQLLQMLDFSWELLVRRHKSWTVQEKEWRREPLHISMGSMELWVSRFKHSPDKSCLPSLQFGSYLAMTTGFHPWCVFAGH